jgi:hypothetical protein
VGQLGAGESAPESAVARPGHGGKKSRNSIAGERRQRKQTARNAKRGLPAPEEDEDADLELAHMLMNTQVRCASVGARGRASARALCERGLSERVPRKGARWPLTPGQTDQTDQTDH